MTSRALRRIGVVSARSLLLSSLLVLSLGAAACGEDEPREPPPIAKPPPEPSVPPRQSGVALSLERETAERGDILRLTVENRGAAPLEYGVAYRLERWEGRWRWINRDDAFILIAKGVQPGARAHEPIRLPADLEPGRYRIVKSFTARGSGAQLDAAVQFEVR